MWKHPVFCSFISLPANTLQRSNVKIMLEKDKLHNLPSYHMNQTLDYINKVKSNM